MRRTAHVAIAAVVAGVLLSGQEPQKPSDIATLGVTVTGRADEYPKGLTAADFRVFEDGREQSMVSAAEGPGAVSLAIVLDSADTMRGTRERLGEQAVERMLATLTSEEEACLVTYGQRIGVAFPWTKGGSFPARDWKPWQTTPVSDILNGVRTALFQMDGAAHPRRAVVAVSSTDENASTFQFRQYPLTRAQSETAIYGLQTDDHAMPTPGGLDPFESRGALVSFDDIVRDSGGRILPVKSRDQTQRSPDALIRELRHQYVLRFITTKPFDGSYRKLKVELRDRKDLRIRHRLGYLAKNPDR